MSVIYSSATYVATGSTPNVTVPFPYILPAHIHVSVNGVQTDDALLSWLNTGVIILPTTPTAGATILVWRATPRDTLSTQFSSPSVLDPKDLNSAMTQLLYVCEEAFDVGQVTADQLATVTGYFNAAVAAAQASADGAATSAGTATTGANTATTQAGIATTQAGNALTAYNNCVTEYNLMVALLAEAGTPVPSSRLVSAGGLVTGGGDLSVDRTLTVPKAIGAELVTGTDDAKAVTAKAIRDATGTAANNLVKLDAAAKLPAVDGSQLTNLPATGLAAATQADEETATSTAAASTPGRQHFNPGHPKFVYRGQVTTAALSGTVSSVDITTERVTMSAAHGRATGDLVYFSGGTQPTGLTMGALYYVNAISGTVLKFYLTYADSVADTNAVNITASVTGGSLRALTITNHHTFNGHGSVPILQFVGGDTALRPVLVFGSAFSSANYGAHGSLLNSSATFFTDALETAPAGRATDRMTFARMSYASDDGTTTGIGSYPVTSLTTGTAFIQAFAYGDLA
jgi:hypothetical protein